MRGSLRRTAMTLSSPVWLLALTAVFAGALVACGSDPADPRGTTGGEPNGAYVVAGITEKGAVRPLVARSEVRIEFDKGQIRINAGCNSMSGTFALDGTRLTVDDLATTEMGCDQALMEQDAWIAGLFAQPVQFNQGNDAAIISGDVVLMLVDRSVAYPDRPLADTRWVLDTLIDDEAASSVPAGVEAFLEITGSRISLKDGCNTGSGAVEVSEDMIVVDQTSRTRMACRNSAEVEGAFTAVLDGAASYSITEDRLTITHDGRGLGFRAAAAR